MTLASNVNRIAKDKNITPYRIAKEGNLSQSYVWEICNGNKKNPSISVIKKIASVLDTTVEDLIS